ncbi:XRE family transcriptional regulator [cyanobacterium G8-9]|nr:XRE family transcriptional regulator [cyanobacterium G8-9]
MIGENEISHLHQKIGIVVKKLREEQSISQLDMTLSIGIKSVAFYSNCENNKYDKHFNVEHLYKIAGILGLSLSTFFIEVEDVAK